ncbi:MAG: phosphotransferase [Bdellovibrionales bacterium]|nr:phosphotransferase [Bdellovibrionales bacterium]
MEPAERPGNGANGFRDSVITETGLRVRISEAFVEELKLETLAEWCRELWNAALLEDRERRSPDELHIGRGSVFRCALPSGRCVVLRLCRRGGMIRSVTRYRFARKLGESWEAVRPFAELSVLEELTRLGLRVPKPVAAAVVPGGLGRTYRGFVATEEVPASVNLLRRLAELRGRPGGGTRARELCFDAGRQAGAMLAAGIFHADLHLGNILVAEEDLTYLIDFDKSCRFPPQQMNRYRERLVRRWKKSVRKHRVRYPDALLAADEGFLKGLELGVGSSRGVAKQ